MPIYSYCCDDCGIHVDIRKKFKDRHQDTHCPECKSKVRRLFTVPTVIYNGKGFYTTDSRSGNAK